MTKDEQNFMEWCQRNNIPSPDNVSVACMAWVQAAREEREACAKVCDSEGDLRENAGIKHPAGSESRDRCFSAARAAMNCAADIRARGQQ